MGRHETYGIDEGPPQESRRTRIQGTLAERSGIEPIVIDANSIATVIEVGGGQIRMGIEAPPEIPVQREEVAVRETVAA